jgi:hypothetical protein
MPSAACLERKPVHPPELIADFGSAVARELSFDPRLARRLRVEIEDHLHEAVADGADAQAENRLMKVMCAFGDPQMFARQFLATALLSLARRAAAVTAHCDRHLSHIDRTALRHVDPLVEAAQPLRKRAL